MNAYPPQQLQQSYLSQGAPQYSAMPGQPYPMAGANFYDPGGLQGFQGDPGQGYYDRYFDPVLLQQQPQQPPYYDTSNVNTMQTAVEYQQYANPNALAGSGTLKLSQDQINDAAAFLEQYKQSQHNLELLHSLEEKLSVALDSQEHGALNTTTDYDQMCKLYSDVINNAELASRKIATTDPAKRQWYKKVLEYQIKEKKFREKLQKQQAKKLELKLEAAEYARAQAQAAMVAQAEAQQAAALEEVKRQNAMLANQPKEPPVAVTPNNGFGLNPSSNQYVQGGLGGVGASLAPNLSNLQNPGSLQNPMNQNLQQPPPQVQPVMPMPVGLDPSVAMMSNPYMMNPMMMANPYMMQQYQMQNMLAQQSQQFFSAITDMISTTLQNTHEQNLDMQYFGLNDSGDKFSEMPLNGGGNKTDERGKSRADPRYTNRPFSPPVPAIQQRGNQDNSQLDVSGGPQQNRPYSPPVPALAKGGNNLNPPQPQNHLQKKQTQISNGNNVSLPGYSKWEHYNGPVITGRSGGPQPNPSNRQHHDPNNPYFRLEDQPVGGLGQGKYREYSLDENPFNQQIKPNTQPLEESNNQSPPEIGNQRDQNPYKPEGPEGNRQASQENYENLPMGSRTGNFKGNFEHRNEKNLFDQHQNNPSESSPEMAYEHHGDQPTQVQQQHHHDENQRHHEHRQHQFQEHRQPSFMNQDQFQHDGMAHYHPEDSYGQERQNNYDAHSPNQYQNERQPSSNHMQGTFKPNPNMQGTFQPGNPGEEDAGFDIMPPNSNSGRQIQNPFAQNNLAREGPEMAGHDTQKYQMRGPYNQYPGEDQQSLGKISASLPGYSNWDHPPPQHPINGQQNPPPMPYDRGPSNQGYDEQQNREYNSHQTRHQQQHQYIRKDGGQELVEGRDSFFDGNKMPSEIGGGPNQGHLPSSQRFSPHIVQPKTGRDDAASQMSIDLSARQDLRLEDERKHRLDRIKANHMKRLKTIDEQKRAESPFLSQHTQIAHDLMLNQQEQLSKRSVEGHDQVMPGQKQLPPTAPGSRGEIHRQGNNYHPTDAATRHQSLEQPNHQQHQQEQQQTQQSLHYQQQSQQLQMRHQQQPTMQASQESMRHQYQQQQQQYQQSYESQRKDQRQEGNSQYNPQVNHPQKGSWHASQDGQQPTGHNSQGRQQQPYSDLRGQLPPQEQRRGDEQQDQRIRQQEVQKGSTAAGDSVKYPGDKGAGVQSGKNYDAVGSNNQRARSQDDRGPNLGESGDGIVAPNMQGSQTDFRQTMGSGQGAQRQPRQSKRSSNLPPRDVKSLKALPPLPPAPKPVMLPPEIANDSDLKLQLADLAEKQMKMIVDYRKDIERLAKDKTQLEGKLEEQSTHQRSEGKTQHQERHHSEKAIGSLRSQGRDVPSQEHFTDAQRDQVSHAQPLQPKTQSQGQRPWAASGSGSQHQQQQHQDGGQQRMQSHSQGDSPQKRHHPLRSGSVQEKTRQEFHDDVVEDPITHQNTKANALVASNHQKSQRTGGQGGGSQPPHPTRSKPSEHGAVEVGRQQNTQQQSKQQSKPPSNKQQSGKHTSENRQTNQMKNQQDRQRLDPILSRLRQQDPVTVANLIGGRKFTDLLTSNQEHLFIIEKQAILERPVVDPKTQQLVDQDMKGLDELDQVMYENVQYEKQIRNNLIWKNFDVQSDIQKIDHLYAVIEQYFNKILQTDYHKISVPVFAQGEVNRKLRSLAMQVFTTQAYIRMVNCMSQEAIFDKIDEAMEEIGLFNIHSFIQNSLSSMMHLERDKSGGTIINGQIVQATGMVPKALQPIITEIKDKRDIDYHNEQLHQDRMDLMFEHKPRPGGIPIYQEQPSDVKDALSVSRSRSQLFEHETTQPSEENAFRISSPVRHVIRGQEKLAYPLAKDKDLSYPKEEDLLQRYAYDKTAIKNNNGGALYQRMTIARVPPGQILEQIPQTQRRMAQSYQYDQNYERVDSQAQYFQDEYGQQQQWQEQEYQEYKHYIINPQKIPDSMLKESPIQGGQDFPPFIQNFSDNLGGSGVLNLADGASSHAGSQFGGTSPNMNQLMTSSNAKADSLQKSEPDFERKSSSQKHSEEEHTSSLQKSGLDFISKTRKSFANSSLIKSLYLETIKETQGEGGNSRNTTISPLNPFEHHQGQKQSARNMVRGPENMSMYSNRRLQSPSGTDRKHVQHLSPKTISQDLHTSHVPPQSPRPHGQPQVLSLPPIIRPQPTLDQQPLQEILPHSRRHQPPTDARVSYYLRTFTDSDELAMTLPHLAPPATYHSALPQPTDADLKLSRALERHMRVLTRDVGRMMTPYEEFVNQWFNQIKLETQQRYFKSNEEEYRKYDFNDNREDLSLRFKLKDEALVRDGIINRKPDAQKLFEKIKEFKNPFIDELFLEKNPSEQASELQLEEISFELAKYQEEFEQLRQELIVLAQQELQALQAEPLHLDDIGQLTEQGVESNQRYQQEELKLPLIKENSSIASQSHETILPRFGSPTQKLENKQAIHQDVTFDYPKRKSIKDLINSSQLTFNELLPSPGGKESKQPETSNEDLALKNRLMKRISDAMAFKGLQQQPTFAASTEKPPKAPSAPSSASTTQILWSPKEEEDGYKTGAIMPMQPYQIPYKADEAAGLKQQMASKIRLSFAK